jgi:hypothetical protein
LAGALAVPIEMLVALHFLKKLPPGQLRDAHKLLLEKFASADAGVRRSIKFPQFFSRKASWCTAFRVIRQIEKMPE